MNLDIIPEETLVWKAYSLNGNSNVSFSGNNVNVSLPELNGVHTIQVFGNNSVGTMFESEVRYFTLNYPIKLDSPFNTTYYNSNHTLDLNISASTWSYFSDFEYSLSKTQRKDITTFNSTIEYVPYGKRTIEVFGKDSYGDEYSSGLINFEIALERQTPSQPDCFTFTNGTLLEPYGDLKYIDGNYSILTANEIPTGSGSWSATFIPNGDVETQWNDGGGTPHYLHVDDDPDNPDGNWVSESATSGLYERYDFEDHAIGTGIITKVKVRVDMVIGSTGTPQINLYFDGEYQGWINLLSGVHDYTWDSGILSDQTDVNNLQVRFKSDCIGFLKFNVINAIEVSVYEEDTAYELDVQVDLQIDDEYCYFPNSISYSFKTNVSQTIDFDIWNWDTESWIEIESVNNFATFDYDLFILDLGSDYVNSTNGVRLRFQSLATPTSFQLEIDQLRLDYYYVNPS